MSMILCLVIFTLIHQTHAPQPLPSVVATLPLYPVKEGIVLAVRFLIDDLQPGHIVAISRQTSSSGIQTLTWNTDVLAGVEDTVFLAVRQQDTNSFVYLLTITTVKLSEAGEYFCQVLSSPGREVASDSIYIRIHYFPPKSPTCRPDGGVALNVYVGAKVSLNCTSAKGHPPVSIEWKIRNAGVAQTVFYNDASIHESKDDFRIALDLIPTMEDIDAVFMCNIHSDSFPGLVRSCQIGPLVVLPRPDITATPVETFTNSSPSATTVYTHLQTVTENTTEKQPAKKKSGFFWQANSLFHVKLYWVVAVFVSVLTSVILLVVDSALLLQLRRLENAAVLESSEYMTPRDTRRDTPRDDAPRDARQGLYLEFGTSSVRSHEQCPYMALDKPRESSRTVVCDGRDLQRLDIEAPPTNF